MAIKFGYTGVTRGAPGLIVQINDFVINRRRCDEQSINQLSDLTNVKKRRCIKYDFFLYITLQTILFLRAK